MADERNYKLYRDVDGMWIQEPLLITISLEEYRSLLQENTVFRERIDYLEKRIDYLESRIKVDETS